MKAAIIGYLLLVLAVGLLVTLVMPDHSEEEQGGGLTPDAQIAERVAAITGGAYFENSPPVEPVSREELERRLAEADAQGPREAHPDPAEVALLLSHTGALSAEEAAKLPERRYGPTGALGAYSRDEFAVFVDAELAEREPKVAEAVAAGELARALETPVADAPRVPPLFLDEVAVRSVLQGGLALLAEREYARRHLDKGVDANRTRAVRRRPETTPVALEVLEGLGTRVGLPRVVDAHRRGGWKAVEELLRDPPATTSALLHDEQRPPGPPLAFSVRPALGSEWERAGDGGAGELDTAVLLLGGVPENVAFKAAAGWRGGRFETWRTTGSGECPAPCREETASVVVHRWGDGADALTFTRNAREALVEATGAQPEGGRGFRIEDGGAALVRDGRFTALVFAPDAPLAGKVAEGALATRR